MSIDRLMKDLLAYLGLPEWAILAALMAIFAYGQWKRHSESREKAKSEKIQHFIEMLPQLRGSHKAILAEQLFLDRYGKQLSYQEIQYFLTTKKPSVYIQHFLNGRRYFEDSSDRPVALKQGFHTKKHLQRAKWYRIVGYGIFSLAGLMMLSNSQPVFSSPPQIWVVFVYLVLSWLFLAYQCLDASTDLAAADKLREALKLDVDEPNPVSAPVQNPSQNSVSPTFTLLRTGFATIQRMMRARSASEFPFEHRSMIHH